MERDAHLAAMRHIYAIDGIHQVAHEEQAASVFAIEIVGRRGIDDRRVEVEAFALVTDLEDQTLAIDFGADVDVFRRIVAVAAQDRVGDRFGQSNGDIEGDLSLPKSHDLALVPDEFDDALDEADVAGNVELHHPDGVIGRRAV